ncbi:MAG: hypothetical protein P8N76_08960 [Pirellulaceae bacterium]|nr:hypothetical protein [Pirellulaceae bacterium]
MIFDQDDRLSFITDSSKNPFWIHRMNAVARKRGWRTLNVLIWKHPFASAHSFNKRGQLESWKREWTQYHRFYFSLVQDFVSLNHAEFAQSPQVLDALCNMAGIDNSPRKAEFWNKEHHNLGGNASTKIHLYDEGNPCFDAAKTFIERQAADPKQSTHRQIYAEEIDEAQIENSVGIKNDREIQRIVSALEWCDVRAGKSSREKPIIPEYSKPYLFVRGGLSKLKHTRLLPR